MMGIQKLSLKGRDRASTQVAVKAARIATGQRTNSIAQRLQTATHARLPS